MSLMKYNIKIRCGMEQKGDKYYQIDEFSLYYNKNKLFKKRE